MTKKCHIQCYIIIMVFCLCYKPFHIVLCRSYSLLQNSLVTVKLTPTVGIIIFTICGVGLLMYQAREMLLQVCCSYCTLISVLTVLMELI